MTRRNLTRLQRVRIFDDADGVCHICKMKIDPVREAWEAEHPVPLGLGGPDKREDMRPAHVDCHAKKTASDKGQIAKAVRQRAGHLGIRKKQSRPMPGTIASGWKRCFDGSVERRK